MLVKHISINIAQLGFDLREHTLHRPTNKTEPSESTTRRQGVALPSPHSDSHHFCSSPLAEKIKPFSPSPNSNAHRLSCTRNTIVQGTAAYAIDLAMCSMTSLNISEEQLNSDDPKEITHRERERCALQEHHNFKYQNPCIDSLRPTAQARAQNRAGLLRRAVMTPWLPPMKNSKRGTRKDTFFFPSRPSQLWAVLYSTLLYSTLLRSVALWNALLRSSALFSHVLFLHSPVGLKKPLGVVRSLCLCLCLCLRLCLRLCLFSLWGRLWLFHEEESTFGMF